MNTQVKSQDLVYCGAVIWYHWIWLIYVHAMVCCLITPDHYLNQYWLVINEVLWMALWMVLSVRLSAVQLASWQLRSNSPKMSVLRTFFTMFLSSSYHESFRSYYPWQKWCPCKRSRSEVKGQGHRGQNPICPFPDCNSNWNSSMATKWCIKLEWA